MATTADLIETLSRQSGVPLSLDANGWCMLEIEELWIAFHGTESHLEMHGMIGSYPTREADSDFWRDALFLGADTLKCCCAGISLNNDHTLILTRTLPCDLPDINTVGALSAGFIDLLRDLTKALPMADDVARTGFTHSAPSAAFSGNPFLAV